MFFLPHRRTRPVQPEGFQQALAKVPAVDPGPEGQNQITGLDYCLHSSPAIGFYVGLYLPACD